jgi:glycosyltransferase involved in cell wall biosynthesis
MALRSVIPQEAQARVTVQFVTANPSRIPNALLFARGIRQLFPHSLTDVRLAIAVGSFVELSAVFASRAFPRAGKIVWLRSIFASEKAHRYPHAFRRWIEGAERLVLGRADRIIANGEDTAAAYRRMGLEVTVIPNATDLDRWRLPEPSFAAPLAVAFIGRLAPVKGIAEFLAAARLVAAGPNTGRLTFHVIGDGPERAAVSAAAAEGLVIDHGPIANAAMPEVLARMDVCVALGFVGSNGGSGISNAVIEQMAGGRLLLCWDNVAYRQILGDESALFVPQGDVRALVEALVGILRHSADARRRAAQGLLASCSYSFDMHMDRFEAVARPWLARKES